MCIRGCMHRFGEFSNSSERSSLFIQNDTVDAPISQLDASETIL